MFISNLNEPRAIMVCRYANPYDPADYAAYHVAFLRLVAAARTYRRSVILMVDLEDGYPQANAVQRKGIGEAWNKVPDIGGVIAIVTSSVVIRGIITAIEWFMKNSPNRRETRAFSRASEALPWLAEQGGVPLADLNACVEAMKARRPIENVAS
jgi:hypothetical protein